MAADEEIERIAAEIRLQQTRGDAIRQQMQEMQATIVNIGGAIDAIQNLKKAKGDVLVPVGAGVFISCPKPDQEKVIISVGAGVMVKKKPEDAIKILEERQNKIAETMASAQKDLEEIMRSIESLRQEAERLGLEEGQDVRPSKE